MDSGQHFDPDVADVLFENMDEILKIKAEVDTADQLIAVFEHIGSDNSASCDAVKAAIEMQAATEDLMKARSKEGKETFEIGIGINTGSAIVGNVGSENRMDYTVIGNSVNIAAKFEQMAKGGEIFIGEQTYLQTQGRFHIQKKVNYASKIKLSRLCVMRCQGRHSSLLYTYIYRKNYLARFFSIIEKIDMKLKEMMNK